MWSIFHGVKFQRFGATQKQVGISQKLRAMKFKLDAAEFKLDAAEFFPISDLVKTESDSVFTAPNKGNSNSFPVVSD